MVKSDVTSQQTLEDAINAGKPLEPAASAMDVTAEEKPRSVTSSAFRFLLVGGTNTVITGALLSLLAQHIFPQLAYAIVYALGLVFSVAMAGRFVFGTKPTVRRIVLYSLLYVVVFLIGLALTTFATRVGLPRYLTGLVVLVTAPLTFLGGRVLFTSGKFTK